MIALVVVSTFVVLVLGVLVAGLLRSHADILRSLHELGVGVGDPAAVVDADGHRAPTTAALAVVLLVLVTGLAQRTSLMRTRFPAGSRMAQSRTP